MNRLLQLFHLNKFYTYGFLVGLGLLISSCGQKNYDALSTQNANTAFLSISGAADFAGQLVGSTTDHTFTVSNTGKGEATNMSGNFFLSVSFNFKNGNYPGEGGTCTSTLPVGSSCTIVISFSPQFPGLAQTALAMSYYDGVAQQSTTDPLLRGTGL